MSFRLALTVLGALLLAFVIACGAYGLSDVAARHSFDVRTSYSGVQALEIDGGDGDVHLSTAQAGSAVAVVERVTEGLTSPHSDAVRTAGGVLHLSAACSFVFSNSCGAGYTISVPPGVTVDAHSGGGNVDADNLTTTGPLKLSSGDGDVNALGIHAADVTLQTGNGDVTATLNEVPTGLKASSGNGDVNLTVPNVTYAVHATSGNGTVSDGSLRIDPTARRTITATSDNGDVNIKAAGTAGSGR
ncbi:MAG: DUF4097 family beta strand repeat protein [Solirubrobacterales bacterium]|nr:DUF4097 family beta strand repeat protein [Solirubrobacterales bacterium]